MKSCEAPNCSAPATTMYMMGGPDTGYERAAYCDEHANIADEAQKDLAGLKQGHLIIPLGRMQSASRTSTEGKEEL